jgi:hypothetical protein
VKPASDSGLLGRFFHGVFGIADSFLNFAFLFLNHAFSAQFVVAGDFTDALLNVADRFVRYAFNLIGCTAHGISPETIDGFWSLRKD